MKKFTTLGVNDLLSIFNGFVFLLIGFILLFDSTVEKNPYVDILSLVLGLLLCGQTQIILYIEKRRPDPFLLVMAYVTTVYYSLRLYTIVLYPYSIVFDRIGTYNPADSNYSLIIILASNAFLAIGFFSHRFLPNPVDVGDQYKTNQPVAATFFLCMLIFLASLNILTPQDNSSRFLNLLILFFSPVNMFIVAATYIFIFRRQVKLIYKITLIVAIVILASLQTLGGSRAAIVVYANYIFFFTIVLTPFFRIKLRTIIFFLILAPVLFSLLGLIFSLATTSRVRLQVPNQSVYEKIEILIDASQKIDPKEEGDSMLGLSLARAGYFDFTSEIIAHNDYYSELFTPTSYIKSLIDNVFTPGFDIFDYPKIGNGLSQIYRHDGYLLKSAVGENYQSDHISLIGESFSAFSYFSFILLFLFARLLKIIYSKSTHTNPWNIELKRIILIILFYSILTSFGFDWVLLDFIIMIISIIIFKRLFPVPHELDSNFSG